MTGAPSRPAGTLRLALTGAGGMLGRELVRAARERGAPLLAWDRAAVDVTDADAVRRALDDARPDVVIHAAAWTDVDGCEADAERALRVNAMGTRHVAAACRGVGARLLTVSTDYVFAGDATEAYAENAPAGPLNVYGWSKLAAEEATLSLGRAGSVARTAWLYADHGRNFLLAMLKLAEDRRVLRVVDDQRGAPTWAADLAGALLDLARAAHERDACGIYHVTNGGTATWNGFARKIFALTGKDVIVEAVTSAEFPRPARRPASSVLADTRRAEAGLSPMPAWEDALARCLKGREGTSAADARAAGLRA
ncbi:MAG: dTDP-4-dehydrorhamnose reductase [bacterium]